MRRGRPRKGERALGPYLSRGRWRVQFKNAAGRTLYTPSYPSRGAAVALPERLGRALMKAAEGMSDGDKVLGKHARDWPRRQTVRLCQAAKVPVVTAHGLRGGLATLALDMGLAGKDVADSLGHQSERTTRTSYAKRGAGDLAKHMKGLQVLTGGKK